jgi:hypothetical protein
MINTTPTGKPSLSLNSVSIKLQLKLSTGVHFTEDYWRQVEALLTSIFASGILSHYNPLQLSTLEVKFVTLFSLKPMMSS